MIHDYLVLAIGKTETVSLFDEIMILNSIQIMVIFGSNSLLVLHIL